MKLPASPRWPIALAAVHAFTNPESDSFHIPGIGYNEKAATRSWVEMKRFFQVQLGR